jgi:hypothetical protein
MSCKLPPLRKPGPFTLPRNDGRRSDILRSALLTALLFLLVHNEVTKLGNCLLLAGTTGFGPATCPKMQQPLMALGNKKPCAPQFILGPPRIICLLGRGSPGIMTWHSGQVGWAVLGLHVASQGDFNRQDCYPRRVALQTRMLFVCSSGRCQSSDPHEVVALLGSLGYPPPLLGDTTQRSR